MNRREMIVASLLGIPLTLAQVRSNKYGLMTIERYIAFENSGIKIGVLLNGVDVTSHCVKAHDVEGWAELLKVNVNGNHYIDFNLNPHEVAREIVKGDIKFLALQCQKS